MFAASPPVIEQQDQQAAGTYTTTPAPVREFPMPDVRPGSNDAQVCTI